MAIGQRTEDGAVELHEPVVCRIGSGVCPATAERRLATAAALIRQSSFLERHPGLPVQVRLARPRPEILLENLVRNLLGPNLESLTQFDLGVQCALNLVRVCEATTAPIGVIDFGCHYTEFAAQLASSKTFHAIIRIGSVHITNDISIGLRTPTARAEKLKHRFGIGQDPQLQPSLESQVQDARFYREIVGTRVSEILVMLERQFPNDFSIRDLTEGLLITGEGSKLPGLPNFLGDKYSLPVRQMSDLTIPWSNTVRPPEETWSAVSLLYPASAQTHR